MTLEVDERRLAEAAAEGFTTAVALADRLVDRGVAFRAAHHVVGALVRAAEDLGVGLDGLADDVIAARARGERRRCGAGPRHRSAGSRPTFARQAAPRAAVERADVVGGTAPARVAAELAEAVRRLGLS